MFDWLSDHLLEVPPASSQAIVFARLLFLLLLAVGWLRFLAAPLDPGVLMGSILHLIHLPFHEAGHTLLRPFGEFICILGGSLFQLLVPLLVIVAFLRQRDPFAAAVAGWWLGQSLLDLSPYIDDARARVLPLLSGVTGQEDWEGHDWYQLLSRTGLLAYDHALARMAWGMGALIMAAALIYGAYIIWKQYLKTDIQTP